MSTSPLTHHWNRLSEFLHHANLIPFVVIVSTYHYFQALRTHDPFLVAAPIAIFVDLLHFRTVQKAVISGRWPWRLTALLTTAIALGLQWIFYSAVQPDGSHLHWAQALLFASIIPLGIAIMAWLQQAVQQQTDWQTAASKAEATAAAAEEAAKTAQAERQALETAFLKGQTRIEQLQSDLTAAQEEATAAHNELTQTQAAHTQLQIDLNEMRIEAETAQARAARWQQDAAREREQAAAMHTRLQQMQQEVQQQQADAAQKQAALIHAQATAERQQEEAAQAQGRAEQMQARLAQMQQDAATQQQQVAHLQQEAERQQERAEAAEEQATQAFEDALSARDTIAQLEAQLTEVQPLLKAWRALNPEVQTLARYNAHLLTAAEAADTLGVHVTTVRRKAKPLNGV